MSDTADNTSDAPEATNDEQTVADMANENTPETNNSEESNERPDWLLDKYATEGKSVDEATTEQAKAYSELSSKLGSFTGAPEEYEVALSEELTEMGVEIAKDDPMIEAAMKFAKDSNMSQDGFKDMVNLYAMQQVAENKANEEYKAEQLKGLGPSADSRIKNIQQWADKNLDAETVQGLEGFATSTESVKAIERLISMTRSASVNVDDANNNSGASAEDVSKLQFEKDEHGNRRINTDPDFKARYKKLRNEVYGTEDHKVIVGG